MALIDLLPLVIALMFAGAGAVVKAQKTPPISAVEGGRLYVAPSKASSNVPWDFENNNLAYVQNASEVVLPTFCVQEPLSVGCDFFPPPAGDVRSSASGASRQSCIACVLAPTETDEDLSRNIESMRRATKYATKGDNAQLFVRVNIIDTSFADNGLLKNLRILDNFDSNNLKYVSFAYPNGSEVVYRYKTLRERLPTTTTTTTTTPRPITNNPSSFGSTGRYSPAAGGKAATTANLNGIMEAHQTGVYGNGGCSALLFSRLSVALPFVVLFAVVVFGDAYLV